MVKWLLGVWTAWAAGIVAAHLVHFSSASVLLNTSGILVLCVGGLTALLYGYNFHLLNRSSDRFQILKSLFPAACPIFYVLYLVILEAKNWNNAGHSPLGFFAAITVLAVVIGLTVVGWRRRWSEMYFLALLLPGVAATAIHLGIVVYVWIPNVLRENRPAEATALLTGLFVFALPGLWAALACTAAALFDADPRSSAYRRAPVAFSVVTKISAMEEDEKRLKQPNRPGL